jgi:hypothetical protein
MAPTTGMASFVKGRNEEMNTDLTDLKRAVPIPGAKEERKQKAKQSTTVRREKSTSGRQSRTQGNAKSNNSSTDNLSTTASTSRQKTGGDRHLETRSHSYSRHATNGDQHPAMFGGTDYDDEPANDQDLPDDPLDPEEARFQGFLAKARDPIENTIAQTHIKGDSYPPTTDGSPSVTDQHDRREVRASGGLQNLPTHAADRGMYVAHPLRQQQQQQPQQPSNTRHQLPTAAHAQGQHRVSTHQLQDTRPLDPEPASEYDVSAGFSFARPPNVKKEVTVKAIHPQKQPVQLRPIPAEVKAEAPRSHREAGKQAAAHADPVANDNLMPLGRHAYRPERQPRPAEVQDYDHHGTSDGQAMIPDQTPASDALTEEDPAEQPEQQEVREESLDYGLAELYNKDYSSLKAETFDHPPNAQPFTDHGLPESAVLTEKLPHLSSAEPKLQSEFFASLDIDEWEEAGDWFLDRFGDMIKKLKDVRRDKRKAARAFEDEIEVREAAVSKKRSLTQAAMDDMKASGAAVLMGTPVKKKK